MTSVEKEKGEAGITAQDVTIGDVSGQVAIGSNITQTQTIQTLTREDMIDLHDNLLQFQKELAKITLPPDESANINSNINLAIKQTEEEKPNTTKIQSRFQGALETIKEVGDTIETVTKWDWTKNILKILGKIGLSIIL